jgi:hypothetical protein
MTESAGQIALRRGMGLNEMRELMEQIKAAPTAEQAEGIIVLTFPDVTDEEMNTLLKFTSIYHNQPASNQAALPSSTYIITHTRMRRMILYRLGATITQISYLEKVAPSTVHHSISAYIRECKEIIRPPALHPDDLELVHKELMTIYNLPGNTRVEETYSVEQVAAKVAVKVLNPSVMAERRESLMDERVGST